MVVRQRGRIPLRQYFGIDCPGRITSPNGAEQDRTSQSSATPIRQVLIGRTVQVESKVRPFRHRPEDALGGGHLDHNLGLDLCLCAFRLHHLPKAIFDRHEFERKPTEILQSPARLEQGCHI